MASSSICEMTGFERQGTYVTPLPQEGLINPHYHTHGATSPQSPPNLQPSTSPALISACSMGAIPNHSILHPLPHPPTPQAIRVNTKRETFLKRIFIQNVNF